MTLIQLGMSIVNLRTALNLEDGLSLLKSLKGAPDESVDGSAEDQGNDHATTDGTVEILLACDEDVTLARQKIRAIAQELGFAMLDQTRIVTAASELARNIIVHAGQGKVLAEALSPRTGIKLIFADKGPGIADLHKAVQEGFSTVGSFGLGLPGAKRLMDEFTLESELNSGTTVTVIKWLPQ